jgi:Holliday junction resolvase
MTRQPESRELKKILFYLRAKGGRWVKIHGGDNPFQEVGVPDILGCYRGRAVAIEVKTPAGHLSVKQERFLTQWRDSGGYTLVAQSVEEVRHLIDFIDMEVSVSIRQPSSS